VVYEFRTWRCYLEGKSVTVQTDHYARQMFETGPNLSRRQDEMDGVHRRRISTTPIAYKPGNLNPADALSRLSGDQRSRSGQGFSDTWNAVHPRHEEGPRFRATSLQRPRRGRTTSDKTGESSYLTSPPYVASSSTRPTERRPSLGHFGRDKTLQTVARLCVADDECGRGSTAASCDTCQRDKSRKRARFGEIQPLPIRERTVAGHQHGLHLRAAYHDRRQQRGPRGSATGSPRHHTSSPLIRT